MEKELPKKISQKWIFWDGDVEIQTWVLERHINEAYNRYIVAYTHEKRYECLETCVGDSYAECEKEMRMKLSKMKFINKSTLSDKYFGRPYAVIKSYI